MAELYNRAGHEAEIARRLAKAMSAARRQLLAAIQDGAMTDQEWQALADTFRAAIQPGLEDVMLTAGLGAAEALGVGIDAAALHARAIEWARTYSYDLVRRLDTVNRNLIAQSIDDYFAQRLTLADVEARLTQAFGPVRASMIAVTEVTRAATQGEIAFQGELRALGVQPVSVWYTAADAKTCPICGPNHGKAQGDGWDDPPPAHPRCRCWIGTEIRGATR